MEHVKDNQLVSQPSGTETEAGPGQDNPEKKRRKVGRRACDGCTIRKVRCSETPPCVRCIKIGIACTFHKRPKKRGPHQLRNKTIRVINEVQSQPHPPVQPCGQPQDSIAEARDQHSGGKRAAAESRRRIQALVARLWIYRSRLFPVWPIVAVDDLIAALHENPGDLESYALANAIGAATIAQLRLESVASAEARDTATANAMEAECERVKTQIQRSASGPSMNLNTLKMAFFLHIYHENQIPGGPKSLLYLREAITVAQIMRMDMESSYGLLPVNEQHARRRAIWLLFVTERGVAMLHKFPLVLKWSPAFPLLDVSAFGDDSYVLSAFRQLVNLFWMFDQSGIFDLIGDSGAQYGGDGRFSHIQQGLRLLLQHLQAPSFEPEPSSDVQKADICITRLWMQAVTWKMLRGISHCQPVENTDSATVHRPVDIAKDLLVFIAGLPEAAVEAHGPAIEFKIFEIACGVIDSMTSNTSGSVLDLSSSNLQVSPPVPRHVLLGLQRLLGSCRRGGNPTLLDLLQGRMANISELGGGRVNTNIITVPLETLRRKMFSSVAEDEDWQITESDVQGTETWSLGKAGERFLALEHSSRTFSPWPLTMSSPSCSYQTRFHQALCSARDFVPAGMTAREDGSRPVNARADGVVDQQSNPLGTPELGLWSLIVDENVLLGL